VFLLKKIWFSLGYIVAQTPEECNRKMQIHQKTYFAGIIYAAVFARPAPRLVRRTTGNPAGRLAIRRIICYISFIEHISASVAAGARDVRR
jgi:hypothetical protein